MFDYCAARVALSWNDNVSLAYHIAFVGEHDKAESSAISHKTTQFVYFKTHHFPKNKITNNEIDVLSYCILVRFTNHAYLCMKYTHVI